MTTDSPPTTNEMDVEHDAERAVADRAPLTAQDRDDIIHTIIGSQALEGVELEWDTVARIVDDVLARPPLVRPRKQ